MNCTPHTRIPSHSHALLHLQPLNDCFCLNKQRETKITTASWIFPCSKKMTPKWQKSLSAVEIDYDDCCTLYSSLGDGSQRCCFLSTVKPMKISLMPVYQYWIQKPRSENKSIIAWKAALPLLGIRAPAWSSLFQAHILVSILFCFPPTDTAIDYSQGP